MKTNHHQPEQLDVFPVETWLGDVVVVEVGEWVKAETEAEKVYWGALDGCLELKVASQGVVVEVGDVKHPKNSC
jgi:hypothetical protein